HLIARDVEAARASLVAPGLEVGERLRVPVAAELVVARKAREKSARPDVLRPHAHFSNADSAGIVADAEIDTVEPVGAKARQGVVYATHGVPERTRFPAHARPPHGVGVARDVHVRGDAERVAAERQVLRVAVEGRGGEIVEAIDAPDDDAELAAKQRLAKG